MTITPPSWQLSSHGISYEEHHGVTKSVTALRSLLQYDQQYDRYDKQQQHAVVTIGELHAVVSCTLWLRLK